MSTYNPAEIERKWQERWLKDGMFAAAEESGRPKFYVLDMFPYPSGDGLHVGHAKIYTASDVVARYMRMKGYNVLHPTGWDAFGLPTENSAIKLGVHPRQLTERNIERFRQQMQALGWSYDWSREINTTDPDYYKWTQWIFLQLFKMGLAYEDTIPINWCPSCKTGLANEEVVDGKCERCGTVVEQRPMRQWMLRITKYADRLLAGLDGLDWPEFVAEVQKNWIGRSEGAHLSFAVEGLDAPLQVFTTRPETLFGATYVVVSPDHPLLDDITADAQREAVTAYRRQSLLQRRTGSDDKAKTGVFTGRLAINPVTQEKIPIWTADYVVMSYGTGAIMAVPAHDERDFEFAKAHDVEIRQVVQPTLSQADAPLPYLGDGVLINSDTFSGLDCAEAKQRIIETLQLHGRAQKSVQYKLRDWVFSRQRYWGEPIPVVHCEKCGTVAVPEKDLPVRLPEVERYEPTGTGESPLAAIEEWVNVRCPTCPGQAKRETNTMPQWAGSSWYWLRYASPREETAFADTQKMTKWLPVDVYIGGSEHAVLHLLYARFWSMVLFDRGLIPQAEPFQRFRSVGLVIGEDGQKMSKSRGNVINPDDVIARFGADALRAYVSFMGPFEASAAWNTDSIKGVRRFLQRSWDLVAKHSQTAQSGEQDNIEVTLVLHRTIQRVSESIEQFKFNTAVAALMEFLNAVDDQPTLSRTVLEIYVLLLSPIAPHLAEELWEKLGHGESLMYAAWPQADQRVLASAAVTIPVQVNGKVRGTLEVERGAAQDKVEELARQLPNVSQHLQGKDVSKIIFVPDRLINFVTA